MKSGPSKLRHDCTCLINFDFQAQRVLDQVRDKRVALNEKLHLLEVMLQSGDFSALDSDPSLLTAAVFDIDMVSVIICQF